MTAPLATTSSFPGGNGSIAANRCHQKQMQSPQQRNQQPQKTTTKITPTSSSSKQKNDSNSKILSAVNDHAAKVMKEKLLSSKTTLQDQSRHLPQFSLEEISMGKFLGKGFFGMVYEINNFNLADDKGNGTTETERQKEDISSSGGRRKFPKFRLFRSSGTSKKTISSSSFSNRHHHHNNGSEEEEEESEMMMMINYGPSITPTSTTKTIVDNDNHHNNKLPHDDDDDDDDDGRTFMAQHCLRQEEDSDNAKGNNRKKLLRRRTNNNMKSRYAIKMLRQEVINDPAKLYYQGIMDINSETVLLSTIEHPNIIKLRAIATSSNFRSRFQPQYFIVLDRLYDTLEKKVHVEWKQRYQRMGGNNLWVKKVMDRKNTKRNKLWLEKMIAAYELSTALQYLHSKRIIHRDLKLDNIGFDIRGDIKIFDFGLAKELPPQDQANSDGAWKMTGETGTPRYMSREVALNLPYNSSSDTYTFCIVLWEMLTMKVPYELYTYKSFVQKVWNYPHKRPPIDDNTATTTNNESSSWPSPIKLLLRRGWSPSMNDRPSMLHVSEILGKQVESCLEEYDYGNTITDIGAHSARHNNGNDVLASRRSTFVWEPPERSNSGSNASLFSMISSAVSSPFVKKSPFPYNSKDKIGSTTTPRSQASKKKDNKILLDGTQETQQMVMLSPSNDDVDENEYSSSNQNNSVLIVDGPVGLPCAPPLFDDDDDDDIQLTIVSEMLQDSSTMMVDLSNKVEANDDDDSTSAQEEDDDGEKGNDEEEEEEEGNAPPCIDPTTSTEDVVALCQSTTYITTSESSEETDSLYVSEETEMDTTTPTSHEERAAENYKDGTTTTTTTTDSPITKNRLWEMIEKEKQRRETIRAHLASYKADTAALARVEQPDS